MSTAVLDAPASAATHEIAGPDGAPVILALGGISATRHVARTDDNQAPGWWSDIVHPGGAIDTTRRRVLGVQWLDGGRGADGQPTRVVTTHDQAAAIVARLDALGIDRVDAAIGASYGGMVALALAERWPERVRRVVAISAAHESTPMATAIRAIERRIVTLGVDTGRVTEGMTIARALAMTTYRTATELAERFPLLPTQGSNGRVEFDVERYLLHNGAHFAARTAPERFLALSLSADLHCVTPERIAVPVTVIAATGDTLVTAAQTRELARRLPRLAARLLLRSRVGHDAFLVEPARLGRLLTSALAD